MEPWAYQELKPGDLSRATKDCLVEAQDIVDETLSSKSKRTVENTLVPLNNLDILLGNVALRLYMMIELHPVAKVRRSAEMNVQRISSFSRELDLNPILYEAVRGVDVSHTDSSTERFKQHLMRDFERSGSNRDEETRRNIADMHKELLEISMKFNRNINDSIIKIEASKDELDGLPQSVISSFGRHGEKYVITTDYPHSLPVLQFCKNEKLRRAMAHAMGTRAPQNNDVLEQLVVKRREFAQLLGYENWAAYVAEVRMVGHTSRIETFINTLEEDTRAPALKDAELFFEYMRRDGIPNDLMGDWNRLYYTEVDKSERGDYNSQEFMEYFPYIHVKQGILEIYGDLFSIEFVQNHDMPVWHDSVDCYDVLEHGKLLGRIYLDMHPRKGKFGHAACGELVQGVEGRQIPEAVLLCNFPGGRKVDGSALMQFNQVRTFFHEFGHLLHNIFSGKQKWVRFSGTSTEQDFVETPSQLLEEWLFDPQVLRRIGRHHRNGASIPESLIEKLRIAEEFGKGLHVRRQIFLSAVSFYLYVHEGSIADLWKEMQGKYSPFVHDSDLHYWTSFGHLDGYSSNYYTYMWSLVIAKDLLSGFDKNNLMDKRIAKKYREMILEPGGSRDAADMVEDFLGRPYNFKAFGEWLNS